MSNAEHHFSSPDNCSPETLMIPHQLPLCSCPLPFLILQDHRPNQLQTRRSPPRTHRGPWEHRKDRAKPSFSSSETSSHTETSGERAFRGTTSLWATHLPQGKGQQGVSSHLAHPLMPQTHPASPQPAPWLGKSHLNQAPVAASRFQERNTSLPPPPSQRRPISTHR